MRGSTLKLVLSLKALIVPTQNKLKDIKLVSKLISLATSEVEGSTKKFHTARTELKRMTELCQKQHNQLKEYQRTIRSLEAQLASQSKQISPFNIPISPGSNISPSFVQTTPTYKRNAKSTPFSVQYQSNLVTPTRISKQRSANISAHSQRSNTSNKISSTVFTPPTPESAGYSNFLKSL
ncbi:hypothetical protein HF086_015042 [Spodoptera exigua]|uniref:Uncharacterized protein n=1 Tax=Spodoptera exigua TaxID=7107 RepID=A0A922M747_SPOEX|nr:hypothetical protein HF086_015042 [Spodoptera exigua]